MTNTPAISVIIPMYNAAKYVGECLESILAQTFQDFEVIIVDDCSTDSSCEIVENYAPKFNGRLALLQLDRNTGSGAVPRNTGLKFARGEYVFFMDADDLLTLTALEELYTLAEDFKAEVVYCEKYYMTTVDLSEIFIHGEQQGGFVDKPTFETVDLRERVQEVLNERFWVPQWNKFVRRDLLLDNEIFFPPVKISEDDIWSCELILSAKKFLRVPNIVYIWRQTRDSMTRDNKSARDEIKFWLNPLLIGLKFLDEFMGRREFFRQNPDCRLAILDHLANGRCFVQLSKVAAKIPPLEIYETIRDEFKEILGNQDVLVAYLCTLVHEQRQRIK